IEARARSSAVRGTDPVPRSSSPSVPAIRPRIRRQNRAIVRSLGYVLDGIALGGVLATGEVEALADADGEADADVEPAAEAATEAEADGRADSDAGADALADGEGGAVGEAVGRGVGFGVSRPLPPRSTA